MYSIKYLGTQNIQEVIPALSALSAAILPHFTHSVRQKKHLTSVNGFLHYFGTKKGQGYGIRGFLLVLTYCIKVQFCIFRICPIMPQFQFLYKTCYIKVGYKMANFPGCAGMRTLFFREKTGSGKSGKNLDPKFRQFLNRF